MRERMEGMPRMGMLPQKRNEEEMMKRLTNLALDFNAGKGNNTNIDDTDSMDLTTVVDNVMQTDMSHVEEFNVENFFNLISNDLTKNIYWEHASLHDRINNYKL